MWTPSFIAGCLSRASTALPEREAPVILRAAPHGSRNLMPRPLRSPAQQLRAAIDCLPLTTRMAMLEGVRSNDIIVGAYTDRSGGVCPMLAAHRCGGGTNFLSVARAWDRFAKVGNRSRRATQRELTVLTAHLEASILRDELAATDLKAALADHRALVDQRRARTPRPGDPDRSKELGGRHGWHWLRPFRRLDEYERALARVEAERDAAEDPERELV